MVATPIGNLADITQRAADILKSVPIVACEDTRRSRVLLAHIGAAPDRLLALHDHNEAAASADLVERLRTGADIALISDAGTPLVSDPGFELVCLAWSAGIVVTPVPGACAVTAAIAAAPIPVNRFRFEGFLPAKASPRRRTLARLLASDIAVVFFEAPHRMRHALADLADLGARSRSLLVCRELTKRYETLRFATVGELLDSSMVLDRGELVCVLAPAPTAATADAPATSDAVVDALAAELPAAQAARLAAKITKRPRSELYRRALSIQAAKE